MICKGVRGVWCLDFQSIDSEVRNLHQVIIVVLWTWLSFAVGSIGICTRGPLSVRLNRNVLGGLGRLLKDILDIPDNVRAGNMN